MDEFDYHVIDREERPWARRLAVWVVNRWQPASVLDIGAGWGTYVDEFRSQGMRCQGIDITQPQPRPDLVKHEDLLTTTARAQVVMCMEVAEHVPAEHAQAIMAAVERALEPGGWIIWTAAQPGQGGVGHINCQPKLYWRGLAQDLGLENALDEEQSLLAWARSGYHMGWFTQNLQIFTRKDRNDTQ